MTKCVIKSLHNVYSRQIVRENRQLTIESLAKYYVKEFKDQPNWLKKAMRSTFRTSFLYSNHKYQPLGIPLALCSVSVISKLCIKNLCISCSSVCWGLFVKRLLMYEGVCM